MARIRNEAAPPAPRTGDLASPGDWQPSLAPSHASRQNPRRRLQVRARENRPRPPNTEASPEEARRAARSAEDGGGGGGGGGALQTTAPPPALPCPTRSRSSPAPRPPHLPGWRCCRCCSPAGPCSKTPAKETNRRPWRRPFPSRPSRRLASIGRGSHCLAAIGCAPCQFAWRPMGEARGRSRRPLAQLDPPPARPPARPLRETRAGSVGGASVARGAAKASASPPPRPSRAA